MADDDIGGSPACFLDEVDPAYAGYLTEPEIDRLLDAVARRANAAAAIAAALGDDAAAGHFTAVAAVLTGEIARRPLASHAGAPDRFETLADSTTSPRALAALEAELIELLETGVPRIASDALHDALNRALTLHRGRRKPSA